MIPLKPYTQEKVIWRNLQNINSECVTNVNNKSEKYDRTMKQRLYQTNQPASHSHIDAHTT